mmetsp:Transcript_20081/g.26530  ORF Transcript_20081/g.26530 Transcript_20081/m.26530 type:complete len:97 (+) Transcript_20081:185-475(+)
MFFHKSNKPWCTISFLFIPYIYTPKSLIPTQQEGEREGKGVKEVSLFYSIKPSASKLSSANRTTLIHFSFKTLNASANITPGLKFPPPTLSILKIK